MKTAIITGGTSGIGLATAKIFLSNDFNCMLVGRNVDKFNKIKSELVGNFEFISVDVRKVEDCDKIILRTLELFGGVDVLINNAGIYHEGAITSVDEKTFDDIFSTNVKGTFFTTRAAVDELIKSRGAIVNVASDAGIKGNYFCAAYAASKGAIVAFTKSLALELASFPVRVNCVAPGDILTPLTLNQLKISGGTVEELAKFYPLGRIGTPAEVAEAIYFLSTASFITGAILSVDGGLTC
ncbi:MAG: SDR family oxidoreductase [Selenomonadaceae bacterium]|nr:SDR family oxidoreductase [Selenomonadaceae bacterium]